MRVSNPDLARQHVLTTRSTTELQDLVIGVISIIHDSSWVEAQQRESMFAFPICWVLKKKKNWKRWNSSVSSMFDYFSLGRKFEWARRHFFLGINNFCSKPRAGGSPAIFRWIADADRRWIAGDFLRSKKWLERHHFQKKKLGEDPLERTSNPGLPDVKTPEKSENYNIKVRSSG